ncbi:hypothetical protein DY000_02029634 [Brassica cretica]|uniref:Uncharacterized protein n=1 Tax=Brassica cretica TaxID=69181 RepID=A0ABQ7DXT2_BRACR|nr:hypothetical protein DY000_02029634 [Brassica cretica]
MAKRAELRRINAYGLLTLSIRSGSSSLGSFGESTFINGSTILLSANRTSDAPDCPMVHNFFWE